MTVLASHEFRDTWIQRTSLLVCWRKFQAKKPLQVRGHTNLVFAPVEKDWRWRLTKAPLQKIQLAFGLHPISLKHCLSCCSSSIIWCGRPTELAVWPTASEDSVQLSYGAMVGEILVGHQNRTVRTSASGYYPVGCIWCNAAWKPQW